MRHKADQQLKNAVFVGRETEMAVLTGLKANDRRKKRWCLYFRIAGRPIKMAGSLLKIRHCMKKPLKMCWITNGYGGRIFPGTFKCSCVIYMSRISLMLKDRFLAN